MKYTKEEISKIVNFKDYRGKVLDIFNLYGSLFLTELGTTKRMQFSAHTLYIIHTDFYWCETEEEVLEQFHESLKEVIMGKLL